MKTYKYKAFISYRHQPYDKAVAEKLHKLIENYHPPKNVAQPEEKWTVFRDQDELPLSSNLGDDIKVALEQSEYLIVICSLRLQASEWCKEEIRYFKELHNGSTKNILAVLIDGTPDECFPPEILESSDNGASRIVEPLAGNIVAPTEKESFKLLRTEYLRLVAYFLGCGFDELYQRARRRRRRIYGAISAAAFSILALIASISIYSAITISNQNHNLLIENSEHLTIESRNLWENGKPIEAIETVLEALPSEDNDRPVSVEAEYLLSEQIGAYGSETFSPVTALKHKTAVTDVYYVGGGNLILTKDSRGIYFWDRESCALVKEYTPDGLGSETLSLYVEENNYSSATVTEGTGLYNTYSGTMNMKYGTAEIEFGDQLDPDIYMYDSSHIWKMDGTTGEILWDYSYEEKCVKSYFSFPEDQLLLNVQMTKDANAFSDSTIDKILTIDPENGKFISTTDCSDLEIHHYDTTISLSESEIIVLTYTGGIRIEKLNSGADTSQEQTSALNITSSFQYTERFGDIFIGVRSYMENPYQKTSVLCINTSTAQILWETEIAESLVATSGFAGIGFLIEKDSASNYSDFFLYTIHNYSCLLDIETGDIVAKYVFEQDITNVHISDNGCVFLTTDDWTEYAINANNISKPFDNTAPSCCRIKKFITELYKIARYEDEYLTLGEDSTNVYLYRRKANADYTKIEFDGIQISGVTPNISGSHALITDRAENAYYLCDLNTMELVSRLNNITPEDVYTYYFIDDSKFLFHSRANATTNNSSSTSGNSIPADKTIIYDVMTDEMYSAIDGDFYDISDDGTMLSALVHATDGYLVSDLDGNQYSWSLKDGVTLHNRTLSEDMRHVFFTCTIDADGQSAVAYTDIINGTTKALKILEASEVNQITEILWLTNETAAILYDDLTVEVYDITKNKCTKTCDFSDTLPADPSSIHSLANADYLMFICKNGIIYKMNLNTGAVEGEINLTLTSTEFLSSSTFTVSSNMIAEDNLLILDMYIGTGWTDSYFIDVDAFSFRCKIGSYRSFARETGKIFVCSGVESDWCMYPYYSTERLIEKANEYMQP